jgi:tagatose 6-phosphate kinase
MIITVTMNPSVDIRFTVKEFKRGGVFRSMDDKQTAGGKGLNVTRVLAQLGAPVLATGLLAGNNGDFIKAELESKGIEHSFVRIPGNTRTCIAILEDDGQTEVLGRGPDISSEDLESFFSEFQRLLAKAKVVTMSGSLPPGAPVHTYRRLIEMAKENGATVILDTSGAPLMEGIKAKPFAIKPNLSELEFLIGRRLVSDEDLAQAMGAAVELGVKNVLVSLGAKGALALVQDQFYRVSVPKITAVNPVGSGDATVAGLAWGVYQGMELQTTLALAMACGVSNAMEQNTGQIDPRMVNKLVAKIEVKQLTS